MFLFNLRYTFALMHVGSFLPVNIEYKKENRRDSNSCVEVMTFET